MLKLSADEDHWEILPYKLASARTTPAAIAMNVDPFINTDEQDCANDFTIPYSGPTTFYRNQPSGNPHVIMILEDQSVLDFDASKEALEKSDVKHEHWPVGITNCLGTFYSNYFVTTGGPYTVRFLFKKSFYCWFSVTITFRKPCLHGTKERRVSTTTRLPPHYLDMLLEQ